MYCDFGRSKEIFLQMKIIMYTYYIINRHFVCLLLDLHDADNLYGDNKLLIVDR